MDIISIINKKRNNLELTKEEIEYVITNYVNDVIADYQMSSLLMAININGMTKDEVIYLTDCMINSGETIDLSMLKTTIIDKHSTGGVGDKTSLIIAPLVASCGVKVGKMSGRGLGYTGGTIDKLESISGFNVNLSSEQFLNQVKNNDLAIIYSNQNLVVADKKIYALRDVTGNVESIPLIASSIMSKKIASGADKIVIDLKVGSGALIKDMTKAKQLASLMIEIGKYYNKQTVCLLTNMNQPLGNAIGNSLEVLESIATLQGNGPKDLEQLSIELAANMVLLGKDISYDQAKQEVGNNLYNEKAYEKFVEWIKIQGGDLNKITIANKMFSVKSVKEGYINNIDAYKIGELVRLIGAGRKNKDDIIDYEVGFVLSKKIGEYVTVNEELVVVYLNKVDLKISDILSCFTIGDVKEKELPLIYEVIR